MRVKANPLVLIAAVLSIPAYSQPARGECPVPQGVVKVALPAELPPALSIAIGDIAMPGEPFDTTDVYVKGHKHRRYMFVWRSGSRAIVAAEVGGIALRAVVLVYELGNDGKSARLVEERITFPGSACDVATSFARKATAPPQTHR